MSPNSCLIYKVRYAEDKRFISHVEAKVYENGKLTPLEQYTRKEIVTKIEKGYTVKTCIQIAGDNYKDGANVGIYSFNGVEYITTDPNNTEADNLGELPTFNLR